MRSNLEKLNKIEKIYVVVFFQVFVVDLKVQLRNENLKNILSGNKPPTSQKNLLAVIYVGQEITAAVAQFDEFYFDLSYHFFCEQNAIRETRNNWQRLFVLYLPGSKESTRLIAKSSAFIKATNSYRNLHILRTFR